VIDEGNAAWRESEHKVEQSQKIDDKYRTRVFETESGKVVTGMILEETPDAYKVIENPLAKAEPVVLKKKDVADRKKSDTSMMPAGLLDKLTREEILDLVAYVASPGDPESTVFSGGSDHAHAGPGHRGPPRNRRPRGTAAPAAVGERSPGTPYSYRFDVRFSDKAGIAPFASAEKAPEDQICRPGGASS